MGVGGEVLLAQHLLAAPADDQRRPLRLDRLLLPLARLALLLGVEHDRQLHRLGPGDGDAEPAPPEGVEGPVVEGDVLGAANERRAPGPVHRPGPVDPGEGQGPGEGHRPADGHVDARPPQDAGERHRHPFDLGRGLDRLRHRGERPCGRCQPRRGSAPAPGPRGT